MNELISREAALEALRNARVRVMGMRVGKTVLSEYATQCRDAMVSALNNVPAADAEYVKHGYWITVGKTERGTNILRCSSCGTERKGVARSAYCRDCGCKMDLQLISQDTLDALIKMGQEVYKYKIDESETFEQQELWPKENPYLKKPCENAE